MWLIRTKLEAPAPTERLIRRQRLRRCLQPALRARLTLVHAPAGFGKTCLLAEWQRALIAQGVRTAWLSVDEEDSEPLQFMAYFATALHMAGIDVGHLGPAAEKGFPDVPISSLIAALDRAIQPSRGRTVVLLDDYHRIQGAAVDAVLRKLIEGLGSRVSFVIAGRELPAFCVADGALRASCIEISGEQLRFTLEETRALLERNVANVSDEDLAVIAEGTDGWAIALAAARDRMANGWSAARVRDFFTRPAADFRRYVTNQILQSLTPQEHAFLLRTAIADRFSEHLAHALCADLPIRELISALERKDLLVVIWDGNERWLRYHRLLAEAAVAELTRTERPAVEALHRCAAEWFFASGHHAEAVRHALATRDDRLLAQLFERAGGWKLVITGHVGVSRNALTLLPPEVLRDYPRAQLARILMLAKLGAIAEARSEIDRLRAMHLPSSDALLGPEVALLDACMQCYEDAPVTAQRLSAFAETARIIPEELSVLRATFANILCTFQYEHGDLEAALATSEDAVAHYRRMSSLFGEVFVYVHQGNALMEIGRLRDAESALRQAWALARDTTGPDTETEAVAAVMLSKALYERGEIDEADKLLAPALRAIEAGESWFDLLAAGYETAALLAMHRGGIAAAVDIAARARQTAQHRNLPRLQRFADLIELRSRMASGSVSGREIASLESAVRACAADEAAPRIRLRMSLALARLLLARGKFATARSAAAQIAAQSQSLRHHRLCIEARIVEAIAAHALHDAAAPALFDAALNLAMYEGSRQVFCDFGDTLRPLLDSADPGAADARSPRVRDRFLRSIIDVTATPQPADDLARLSDRERAVLRLLGEGLSNKAIARALRVSDNTVKFHLKNLFTKLGVGTRIEAVQWAAAERLASPTRQ